MTLVFQLLRVPSHFEFCKQTKVSAICLCFFFQNAWVQESTDTRNVGVHEIIVEVQDVPDTPPYFLIAPPVTKLAETAIVVSFLKLFFSFSNSFFKV